VRDEFVERSDAIIRFNDERFGPLTDESKRRARERIGKAGDPLPAVWSAMVLDVQGGVWLQRASCYAAWLSDPTTTWEVIGPQGDLIATVEVPRNVTILSVDGDRVLASQTDTLEVQYLALYRVER
jgi:hypothetical protein